MRKIEFDAGFCGRILTLGLIILALVYAFLAGLHTISDPDAGWQMATGRYLLQHHVIPRGDVLSYTAPGVPFIYPPFAGAIFYLTYLAGGWAALSWFCALAAALTAFLMLRRGGASAAALVIFAAPLIAYRCAPRGDLFTTIIFAWMFCGLWRWQRGKPFALWTLPLAMLLWVNLHTGFVAGIGVMAAYLLAELCDLPWRERRAEVLGRLRRAWPWMTAAVIATLINPWGPWIYTSATMSGISLSNATAPATRAIGEFAHLPTGFLSLALAANPRLPDGGYWWLVLAILFTLPVALWLRRLAAIPVLGVAVWFSLAHLRYSALFCVVTVCVCSELWNEFAAILQQRGEAQGKIANGRLPGYVSVLALVFFALLVQLRATDLVRGVAYAQNSSPHSFGAGESWWYSEGAASFIEREHLPGNLYEPYNMGGFLSFRLGPAYKDFIDGRNVDGRITALAEALETAPPDSGLWQQNADQYHINIVLFPLVRYGGLGNFNLQAWCRNTAWQPVYLDEAGIVLMRNTEANRHWLDRFAVDCQRQKFVAPAGANKAVLFNFYSNTAAVEYVLQRDHEALEATKEAETLIPEDANIHMTRAQIFQSNSTWEEAREEYLAALNRRQSDIAWIGLGHVLVSEKKYDAALRAYHNAAQISYYPAPLYLYAAKIELVLNRPQEALRDLERSSKTPLPQGYDPEFYAQVDSGKSAACEQLKRYGEAAEWMRQALTLTPNTAIRWRHLSSLYNTMGNNTLAAQALQRANALESGSGRSGQ